MSQLLCTQSRDKLLPGDSATPIQTPKVVQSQLHAEVLVEYVLSGSQRQAHLLSQPFSVLDPASHFLTNIDFLWWSPYLSFAALHSRIMSILNYSTDLLMRGPQPSGNRSYCGTWL